MSVIRFVPKFWLLLLGLALVLWPCLMLSPAVAEANPLPGREQPTNSLPYVYEYVLGTSESSTSWR